VAEKRSEDLVVSVFGSIRLIKAGIPKQERTYK
jgi:hypothetical protein